MNRLVHELREARPSLRLVSPLAHWIVLLLGIFNIFLGLTLMFGIDKQRLSASLIIVNEITSYTFWGVVFILLGILKLYSLKINNWRLSRNSLIIGVAIKAMWSVALIFRIFISPGTVFITLCWLIIAAMQMATYIFFMPPSTEGYKQRRKDR
jgi:hypothetical protein